MIIRRFVVFLATALLPIAVAAQTFPDYTGFVNDFADVLSPDTEIALTRSLTDYEKETTHEIAVATVRSLEGNTAELYTRSLHDRWGVGKPGKDNGILVLLAPTEREVWISVGSGLEAAVSSSLTQQIIDGQMMPALRSGDYSGAVRNAVTALQAAARAAGNEPAAGTSSSSGGGKSGIIIFIIVVVAFVGIAILAKKKGGGKPGSSAPSSRSNFGGGSSSTSGGAGGKW